MVHSPVSEAGTPGSIPGRGIEDVQQMMLEATVKALVKVEHQGYRLDRLAWALITLGALLLGTTIGSLIRILIQTHTP